MAVILPSRDIRGLKLWVCDIGGGKDVCQILCWLSAELLDESGYAGPMTLLNTVADPVNVARSRAVTAFAAEDCPVNRLVGSSCGMKLPGRPRPRT